MIVKIESNREVRGVASRYHGAGAILLAAALIGLALHVLSIHMGAFAMTLKYTGWHLIGTPALITVLALALYPKQLLDKSERPREQSTTVQKASTSPVTNIPGMISGETESLSSRPGLFKRMVRKLGVSRRLLGGGGSGGQSQGHALDIPFLKRRVNSVGRSRASSENGFSTAASSNRSQQASGARSAFKRLGSLARIPSRGNNLDDTDSSILDACASTNTAMSCAASSTKGCHHQPADVFVYNGHLAVDCLPYDTTDPALQEVKKVITEHHLLQFGMMIGESSAELAIGMQGASHPVGHAKDSLYGLIDCPQQYERGWERIVEEHREGLHYWVCRRHLRRGLYMYRSRTVYERATPPQMVAFTFAGLESRKDWDDSAMALQPIVPPSVALQQRILPEDQLQAAAWAQSSFIYARTRFPPPMAQREYVYARRIWYKADDGGCYCITKSCQHPEPPPSTGRCVRVNDFANGFVIRAVPGIYSPEPAVEVVTNYFEDPCAHSGILNLGIRKGLWPMIQKSEKGLRRYVAAHGHALPARRVPPFPAPTPSPGGVSTTLAKKTGGRTNEIPADKSQTVLPQEMEEAQDRVQDRALSPESLDLDLGLRNAGMFSGYYPALSRGLHVTPILYAGYLAVWRGVALMYKASLASAHLTWGLACSWNAGCWRMLRINALNLSRRIQCWQSGIGLWPTPRRPPLGGLLSSFPLDSAKKTPYTRGSNNIRRQSSSRMTKLAGVVARAAGMPLLHALLNGKFPSFIRGAASSSSSAQPSPIKTSAGGGPRSARYPLVSSPLGASSTAAPSTPGCAVPKVQRSRQLLHVMFGIKALPLEEKRGGGRGGESETLENHQRVQKKQKKPQQRPVWVVA